LHVEEGPWLPVDLDDVAEKAICLAGGREELTIGLVLLRRKNERDVVNTIAAGKIQ
jgi:hypothetical protein